MDEFLVIRKDQMDILSAHVRTVFEREMIEHLRKEFPESGFDQQRLQLLVTKGIEQAALYGVTLEDDVRQYLEYCMRYGEDFDRNPKTSWASEILTFNGIDGSRKIRRIAKHIRTTEESG